MYKGIIEMVQQCHVPSTQGTKAKNHYRHHINRTSHGSKLPIDQFSFSGMNYIVTMDYYSDYFEIDRLQVITSCSNVKALKKHFARFGIPEEIIRDNGPNFVSQKFATFTNRWDIRHSTSSPNHSQGNGKAESAARNLFQTFFLSTENI